MGKKLSVEEKERYLNMLKQASKSWEKRVKEAEDCGEKVENYLKEHLTLELDEENRANIMFNIRSVCKMMILKKYYMLLMQSKHLEAHRHLMDDDNLKKAEKEVREKFHVPDSIPIIYK